MRKAFTRLGFISFDQGRFPDARAFLLRARSLATNDHRLAFATLHVVNAAGA